MIAGIITVPGREKMVDQLVGLIKPSVDSVAVYKDHERLGHWYNLMRCMSEMTDRAKQDEPVLITTDDVITVPDWRERWEAIHAKANDSIYVMMSRQKHLFTLENIARGYVTKLQLRGYYDHAVMFINKKGFMGRVMKWYHGGGCVEPRLINRSGHLDVVIQEYLLYNGIPWTITTPTLFDHIGKSTMGHKVGGSPMYVGNYL